MQTHAAQVRLQETDSPYLGVKETSYCQLRTQVCVCCVHCAVCNGFVCLGGRGALNCLCNEGKSAAACRFFLGIHLLPTHEHDMFHTTPTRTLHTLTQYHNTRSHTMTHHTTPHTQLLMALHDSDKTGVSAKQNPGGGGAAGAGGVGGGPPRHHRDAGSKVRCRGVAARC